MVALRQELEARISSMQATDMALVVSQGQNEIAQFEEKGLDILPHRARMNKEALDEHFKNPTHPLRIVFVCAMWMTGFDVPSCSTLYLDKPMRNHTLMQTIARWSNRSSRAKAAVSSSIISVSFAIWSAPWRLCGAERRWRRR